MKGREKLQMNVFSKADGLLTADKVDFEEEKMFFIFLELEGGQHF